MNEGRTAELYRVSDDIFSTNGLKMVVDDDHCDVPEHFSTNGELLDFMVLYVTSPSNHMN